MLRNLQRSGPAAGARARSTATRRAPCRWLWLFERANKSTRSHARLPGYWRKHSISHNHAGDGVLTNKSILDQGWFEWRRQLEYKQAWSGGWLVAVPPQNTSRTCPCCGHVSAQNRKTQAQFECAQCGFEENADGVGVINVLRAGHARFACQVSGATMPPATGTHRSDSGKAPCQPVVHNYRLNSWIVHVIHTIIHYNFHS